MAIEHICTEETCTLRPEVRKRLRRIQLLRWNAEGARQLAKSLDAQADALNAADKQAEA